MTAATNLDHELPLLGTTIRFVTYQPVPRDEPDSDPKQVPLTGIVVGHEDDSLDPVQVLLLPGLKLEEGERVSGYDALTLNISASDIREVISNALLYDGGGYDGEFVPTHANASYMGSAKVTSMVLEADGLYLSFEEELHEDVIRLRGIASSMSSLGIGGEVLPQYLVQDHEDHFSQHMPVEFNEDAEPEDNDWIYDDGDVYAEFTACMDGRAAIHVLEATDSDNHGARKGIGRKAIKAFREHFPYIIASGVGDGHTEGLLDNPAFLFWKKMLEEDLIDGIDLVGDNETLTRENIDAKIEEIEANILPKP